jgi:hypothetical protein
VQAQKPGEWRGGKLVGVTIYTPDNQKLGDVSDFLVDDSGAITTIVLGVGGFLGIGEKNVAIPWEKVQWNMGGNQSSGSMAQNTSAGGQPAGDRSSPRDIAQTTTGAPNDHNAQPTAASGGASLSSAPSSGTTGNNPANSSASVSSGGAASTNTNSSSSATAGASGGNQDYPDRAMVAMSKQDLQNAPEFKYASQSSSNSGSSSGGSSMTGSTGSTSGR